MNASFSSPVVRASPVALLGLGLIALLPLPNTGKAQTPALDHFVWTAPPALAPAGHPFAVTLEARSAADTVVTQFLGSVALAALAPPDPEIVLLTEVETVTTKRVELSVVGSAAVDLSGWELVFYDSEVWPQPKTTFTFPVGTVCAPGAVWEVRSGGLAPGSFPTFFLGLPLQWGPASSFPYAAVALRRPSGSVADFFCAGAAFANQITQPLPIADGVWSGLPAANNSNANLTYQRGGNFDHHNAGNWQLTNHSAGVFNSTLELPFLAPPKKLPVTPSSVTFTNGSWSGLLVVTTPATNVVLRADDFLGHTGDSPPLTIAGLPPLQLQLPTQAFETNAGLFGSGLVSVPTPLLTNLVITLVSSDPAEITLSPVITLLAGTTSTNFALTNWAGGLPQGPQPVTITASAAGFAHASGLITNYEVGQVTLSLVVPPNVSEGAGWISNATVLASTPVGTNVTVALSSSHPNLIKLPASVVLPSGGSSVPFAFQVLNDGRLAGPQNVTLSATVSFWQSGNAVITVADAATTNLTLTLPPRVTEGSVLTNAGRVSISGTLPTNVLVSLVAGNSARLVIPATVFIPAGQTSTVFNLTAPDDLLMQASEAIGITASAAGLSTAQAVVNVEDNDVHHLSFGAIPGAQALGVPFAVSLYAQTIDSLTVTGFTGSVQLAAQHGSLAPPGVNVVVSNGVWSGLLTVTNGSTNVFLTASAAGLPLAQSNPFKVTRPVIRQLTLPTKDLVYDPFGARLYASVPATGGVYSNCLVRLNPVSGTIEAAPYFGSDPNQLALSDDGQFLYGGVDGESVVRQFNLNSQTVSSAFSLTNGYFALDLAVMPGAPEVVAVSRSQFPPFGPVGVTIFDHGIKRSTEAGEPAVIAFGAGNVLYGYWNYTTAFGFYRMLVDANGVTVHSSSGPLIPAYAEDIQYDSGAIYTTRGAVLDPDAFRILGQLPVSGPLRSDAALNRIYVLHQSNGSWFLGAYDRTTLARTGTLPLPGLAGTPSSLVRWGTNGLAFRTSGNQIFVLETELVPQAGTADLAVQQPMLPGPVNIGSNLICTVVVTNQGPQAATSVVLQNELPPGAQFISATATKGTWELKQNVLVCPIGNLAAGESASLSVTLRPTGSGMLTNIAAVVASQPDPKLVDNRSAAVALVGPLSNAVALAVELLAATDLAWHPVSNRLYATVASGDPRFGSRLLKFNPDSGQVEDSWFIGSSPTRLVFSTDYQYLYVAIDGGARVRRFNLATQTTDLTLDIQLGVIVDDLAALTGLPQSVAITRRNPHSSPSGSGMVVYDNNVLRLTSDWSYLIERGEDATSLYNYVPGSTAGVQKLQLSSTSATALGSVGLGGGFLGDFRYDAGLLITTEGELVYAPTVTPLGVATNLGSATTLRLVSTDVAANRFFNLGQSGGTAVLRTYSCAPVQFLGATTLSGITGTVSALTRWGTNGLAFGTSGGQLFLLRSDLAAPTNAPCDLVVTQTLPGTMLFAAPVSLTVTVSNRGPSTAANVILTDLLPKGGAFVSGSVSQGSVQSSNGLVTCHLGALAAGASATLSFTTLTHESGALQNAAWVAASGPDLNPLDNFTTTNLPTSFLVSTNLPIGDLVYDPARALILASIGPSGGALSNCIVEIDPVTGAVGRALPQAEFAGKLALADNSQFLYAGLINTGGVARINLALWTNDLYFSLGVGENGFRYTAGDMQVVPGQPHAVAVSVTDFGGNVSLTIYDDGVPRSNSVPQREYGGIYPIGFSTNSAVLYQTTIFSFRTIAVNAGGATLTSEVGNLTPFYAPGFRSEQGLIFFESGRVVNPVLQTIITNFPIGGALVPDLANGRVLFVTGAGQFFNWQFSLRAFDPVTTRELWRVPFPAAQSSVTRLIKLGPNGVAFTTDANRLFIVHTDQLQTPRADLQVTQTATSSVLPVGASSPTTITLLNRGPWTATSIFLTNLVSPNLTITAVTTSRGTVLQTNPAVLVSITSLTNGESATVTVSSRATSPGAGLSQTEVTAALPDPNPGNNTATTSWQLTPALALTISDASAREGNIGFGNINFTLSLSASNSVPVSFRYQTADGTARAGTDYQTNAGLFTWPPGTNTRVLSLFSTIRANATLQSNRFFFLHLSAPTNVTLLDTQAVATILEDDFRTITVANLALAEGNQLQTNMAFTFTLSPASPTPVSVDYQTRDGSGTASSDYAPQGGTLVFAPGITNLTLGVPVFGDPWPEMDEIFALLLSEPSGATLGVNAARGTILNDDLLPPVAFTSVAWDDQSLHLQFPTISGRFYRVEQQETFGSAPWTVLTNHLPGTGAVLEVIDATAAQRPQSFYRLVLLP